MSARISGRLWFSSTIARTFVMRAGDRPEALAPLAVVDWGVGPAPADPVAHPAARTTAHTTAAHRAIVATRTLTATAANSD
jgi:hypothetical protein